MNAMTWYAETVGTDSTNRVADRAGLVQTTLGRQLKSGKLSAETVVAVADAYGRDVLDALVILGLITREQIRRHGIREALAAASDEEIAEEVWKRLTDGREHGPFDETPDGSRPSSLHPVGGGAEMPTAAGTVSDDEIEEAKRLPYAARERTPGPDSQDVE